MRRLQGAARGLDATFRDAGDGGPEADIHAELAAEIAGDTGDRVAALDPELMGRIERAGERLPPQRRRDGVAFQHMAAAAHRAGGEFLDHRQCLRPARRDQRAAVMDRDAGPLRQIRPDRAAAAGAVPGAVEALAGDRDEAEIADAGAVGPSVALQRRDVLAGAGREQRMRQADDPGAHHDQVEARLAQGHVHARESPGAGRRGASAPA